MSRQSYIDTFFWSDPWIQKIGSAQKYLFLYLLTYPEGNVAGIYEVTDSQIVHDTGLDIEDVQRFLAFFQEERKVYRWKDYIIMKNWPKHQNIHSPKITAGIERILGTLSPDLLRYVVEVDYQYPNLAEYIENHPLKPRKPDTLSNGGDTVSNRDNEVLHSTSLNLTIRDGPAPKGPALSRREECEIPSPVVDKSKRTFEHALGSLRRAVGMEHS